MSYFACHVEKFKSNDVRGLQIHNQRESSNTKNNDIDKERTILNYDLHNENKINYNQRVKEIIAEGYKGAKAIRKDATVMTSTIVTSDKGFFDTLSLAEQRRFFEEAYKALKECYGEKNIVSAVVHMDETTPHMHLTAVPLTDDGKLSAKIIIDRKFLRHIQKAIPELLQSKGFDIERGVEGSDKEHTTKEEYIKKLKSENKKLQSKIDFANKIIGSLSKEFQDEFLDKRDEMKAKANDLKKKPRVNNYQIGD